ncbi:hypothetical protein PMG11_02367 [Penicillium brasilianum]|uniref:Fungal lipase-type domain-containing protein n=1 Tax=Penicillium brasilianum TaxID=104259 RepID=A0A0F7TJR8_PENBI|nr:hypothetical protein PMG11_02367 [Penicillium brasilianum]
MFSNGLSFFAIFALGSQVIAAPTVEKRATSDPSAFTSLQRAAKLSSAAYTGCLGTAFDVTITKQIYNALTDTQGYVGYSSTQKKISVVMRGSTTPSDILNDVDTTLVTPSLSGVIFPSGVQIMNGVYRPWASVHDDVITEVKSLVAKYPDYTLESTGHSLGGALTYVSYVALAQNFPGISITSNALAAFPIGNAAWASFGSAQHGTLNRGNNVADGVPNMYIQSPYNFQHYGVEYYSSGTAATCVRCSGERDTACSAGNGQYGVTIGHFQSFGITMGSAGC